jgi:hypothetical protein
MIIIMAFIRRHECFTLRSTNHRSSVTLGQSAVILKHDSSRLQGLLLTERTWTPFILQNLQHCIYSLHLPNAKDKQNCYHRPSSYTPI